MNNKKKYLDLDALKIYHSKLKPVIESKANSSEVYNKTDVYNRSEVDSALDSKSNVGHTHDQYATEQNVYTKEQVDAALESKSDISHTHDQYLTSQDISGKADKADTLAGYGITDAYTKNEVDNKLDSKANTDHTHGNITKDGLLTTADQVVVTDANKKITSVAKGTAFNKDFGTTAGTVSEGNHTHDDMYVKGPSSATNNNIAIFDGETGKLIKTSTASIDNQTLSIHTKLSFRNRENPSIEMISNGKNFYLQSFQGKIYLGSTLNTSTYWDADGVARFQAIPNVKGKNISLEGHTHTASEITDFPTIPTVNNATLTIQKNGTNVATFTANSSTNTTANITVPTKVSELTNDSGYLTSHQSLENYATKSDLANYLPLSGGTLTGNLSGKYITGTWLQTTAASDLGSAPPKYGVISSGGWLYTRTLAETKTDLGIPTKVSQLDNDSGYTNNTGTVTSVAVKMNGATKGTVTSSGTIDLGTVITSHQDISGKADKATTLSGYGITNAYTKTETNNLINSRTKTVVFDTYNKFIQFLEDTSQATYDYFNIGDSIYIKEEGSNYWISGKEDIVEGGYSYNRIISGRTGSSLMGTDNIYRTTVTENIGTTYTSVEPYEVKPQSEAGYSNFSWNSSTGDVKITLESLRPNTYVTVTLKTYAPASGGGDYGYYYISNIGPNISGKADKATTLSGYGITNAYTKTETDNKLSGKANKATTLSGYGITNAYTKTETDNKLSGKSNVGHSHESVKSVIDYGNTSDIIKIGYRGNGLTASQIEYIAGYTAGDNANEHKIKDISKDVLKNWLGYSEVSTGVWSPGSTWIGTSGYVWIIFPYDVSANTFKFTYGSGDRTGYGFAILQGEGCIRYFQSTTQLTRYSTSRITFSTQMRYIKFKMDS